MTLVYWHWWALGLVLMAVETFLPGAFFLWMGLGALVVGVLLLAAPGLSLVVQILVWAAVAVGSVLLWRRLRPAAKSGTPDSDLNERGRLYAGRSFTLDAPIVDGMGRLRIDDGQWRIAGPDLPAGARVRVVAVDGATLKVEKSD